jgi:hypothetical protein
MIATRFNPATKSLDVSMQPFMATWWDCGVSELDDQISFTVDLTDPSIATCPISFLGMLTWMGEESNLACVS